ncbi:MAG TPA: cupin domain-containing protein [Polyangiaceae bacterium]|nr:cupin domain-containing protein [Polyangiaceae bacterium]
MPPHWCTTGHVGQILAGELEIEFESGTETFRSGDTLFIPPGDLHAHRAVALTPTVVALFVEDR